MEESAVEAKACSRIQDGKQCTNQAAAANGWCRSCRAKYQREYSALRVNRAYSEGAGAMKAAIILQFANLGMMPIAGVDVARHVRRMEIPDRVVLDAPEE